MEKQHLQSGCLELDKFFDPGEEFWGRQLDHTACAQVCGVFTTRCIAGDPSREKITKMIEDLTFESKNHPRSSWALTDFHRKIIWHPT